MTTIYIARYEHRYGNDIRVFASESGAANWREAIAREWWDGLAGMEEAPDYDSSRPAEMADLYFDHMAERDNGEWFSIERAELEP